MGKLFDRVDCAWELAQVDRAEQEASATLSGFQLAAIDQGRLRSYTTDREGHLRSRALDWDSMRRACRMKLLKTGQLMADLRGAMSLFRACPHCFEEDGRRRACDAHKAIVNAAMLAVKWAGEDNMATRLAQGRVWGDEEPRTAEDRHLNEWERWYYRDKKEGIWPGDATWAKREFGDLGYRGWLQFIFEEEEISYADYVGEKERLDAANCA